MVFEGEQRPRGENLDRIESGTFLVAVRQVNNQFGNILNPVTQAGLNFKCVDAKP